MARYEEKFGRDDQRVEQSGFKRRIELVVCEAISATDGTELKVMIVVGIAQSASPSGHGSKAR